jgi:hypothetical protein
MAFSQAGWLAKPIVIACANIRGIWQDDTLLAHPKPAVESHVVLLY